MMSASSLHMQHTDKYKCSYTVKQACTKYTHLTVHMLERENKREDRKGELQEIELIVKHQNGFKVTTSTQNRLCIVYKELAQLRTVCIFSDRRCLHLNSSPTPQRWVTEGEHWSLCEKQWLHRVTGG